MDDLLANLIAIPSVSDDIEQADRILDYTGSFLAARGMHVQRFSNRFPSLIATTRPTKTPRVFLYSHMDVVPGPPELFTLRLENGMYYGRGVHDMKFAAAAYMHLVDELQTRLDAYDFGIMLTTDEERYGQYGAGYLTEQGFIPSKVCIIPDTGSDNQWQVETFSKGCWLAEITVVGIGSHGSRPWEGDSANLKLIALLHDVATLFKDAQKPDTPTLNIGIMQGGQAINQTPDAAMATLDIRYNTSQEYLDLSKKISNICDQYGATLRTTREPNDPTITDPENPYVASYFRHVEAQTGQKPKPITSYGATDARFFTSHGVPCIMSRAPGSGSHGNDEQLVASAYEDFKKIIRAYTEEHARVDPSGTTLTIAP